MRNSTELSPAAVANFVRSELASSLRSRNPYTVNLLLAGVDVEGKEAVVRGDGEGSLYWLDYLASLAKVPYAAHGYAQYYCLSILDKHHHPGIGLEEGLRILKMCTDELKRRLPIDFKGVSIVYPRREIERMEANEWCLDACEGRDEGWGQRARVG
jgi:20S proteasome alpha/beta subunit